MSTILPPLVLRVGSNLFYANRVTLTEKSAYFRTLLGPDFASPFQADGSLFIDSDGDVFAHILTYLRHGIMPVFFNEEHGHDKQMYERVLDQAKYFQVQEIVKWIERRGYENDHKQTRCTCSTKVLVWPDLEALLKEVSGTDISVQDIKKLETRRYQRCANGGIIVFQDCLKWAHPREYIRQPRCTCKQLATLCVPTDMQIPMPILEEDLYLVTLKTVSKGI